MITEKPYLQYLMEFRSPAPQKGLGKLRFCGCEKEKSLLYMLIFSFLLYYSSYHSAVSKINNVLSYLISVHCCLLGVMPKHGLDVASCEVFRFYKLVTLKGLIEPISMIVPRRVSKNKTTVGGGKGLLYIEENLAICAGQNVCVVTF